MLDQRISEIELHDFLHRFRAKRGCGTGIMEATLLQQLAAREQVPLYGIFLDLRKAFDAMNRGRCLQILEDAGVGPKALHIIRTFWAKATLHCRLPRLWLLRQPLQRRPRCHPRRAPLPHHLQHHGGCHRQGMDTSDGAGGLSS